jgi:hypothetical protein
LDENLTPKIAHQLRLRGIDAVTVRDLGRYLVFMNKPCEW